MTGRVILDELERFAERVTAATRLEKTAAKRAERVRLLEAKIAAYLADHPDATANAVWREVGGRRATVLQAVQAFRERYPSPGNHTP